MVASVSYRLGRSLRSYRDLLNTVIREVYEGKRPADDAAKIAAAVKPAVEIFMAEKMLAGTVDGDKEVLSTDPVFQLTFGRHRRVRVQARTGLDKHGAVVDDKVVTIEGDAVDADDIAAEAVGATL